MTSIAHYFNIQRCSVYERLNYMQHFKLIQRVRNGANYEYSLTKRGQYLLKCLSKYAADENSHQNLRLHK